MTQAYIVIEKPTDADILKKLLPSTLPVVQFVNGEGKYGAESMARKLLVSKRLPVVLVIDADTSDNSAIREKIQNLNFLLHQSAARTPYKILVAVPSTDVLFFQERQILERIIDRQLTDLEWRLAQNQPTELLDTLPGGRPAFLRTVLNQLPHEVIQVLQQHPLIQELIEFISQLAPTPEQACMVVSAEGMGS